MVNRVLTTFFLGLVVFFIFSPSVFAQNYHLEKFDGPDTPLADSLFSIGEYQQSINELKRLVEEYPRESAFHYKLGMAFLYGTRDIDSAIEFLRYSSSKEVPNSVYFHLGYAYQKSYNFSKAIEYYKRFSINQSSLSITTEQMEHLLGQCESGDFMLKYIHEPKIIDKKRVNSDDLYQFMVTRSKQGSFVARPNDIITKTDAKQNLDDPIFFPNDPKPGDRVIYASYGSTTSFGKDLYMIEMQANGLWSKPKDLGDNINTDFDEDFPYLASDGVTLYFASKGHYSMGGYDIYRAIYNPSTGQWSSPENLGFPFSSPYDDFMFVPNDEETMATFVTNRGTISDSIDIVLVEIDENPIRRTIVDEDAIKRIARLDVLSSAHQEIGSSTPTERISQPASAKEQSPSFSDVENDPEYSRALAQGFAYQIKADSLRDRLEVLRERFDYVNTAAQRVQLEKQVVAVEDNLLDAQRNADIQFAKASQIEQEFLVGKRKPVEKPQSSFSTDKPDFLYQAQYAPTVFHKDELAKLARAEQMVPIIDKQRQKLIASLNVGSINSETDSTADKTTAKNNTKPLMQAFNKSMVDYVSIKKPLYSDCISVALMKSVHKGNEEVKRHISTAQTSFRSATAIRNNADSEHRVESEYEALLLDELGILRLELAFAKIWNIKHFEQEVLQKIFALENFAFGDSQVGKQESLSAANQNSQTLGGEKAPAISRIESIAEVQSEIQFEPDPVAALRIVDEKEYYKTVADIPTLLPLPQGVVYRIQLVAFSRAVETKVFKGLFPLWKEPVSNGAVTKYYAGDFRQLAQAEQDISLVRERGFKDAFIVAWHNGRTIQPSRAASIENSETTTPNTQVQSSPRIAIEEEDGTLYMIHIGDYPGSLPAEVAQTVRTLALGKDLVRKPNSQGGYSYSVGSYSSAAEAERIKDIIVTSGIKNVSIIAVSTDN